MPHLHFDCFSGISGDMTLAALVGVGVPLAFLNEQLASLNLGIQLEEEKVLRGCFEAIKVHVTTTETDPPQRHLPEIERLIDDTILTPSAKTLAKKIFHRMGLAEAAAHGMPLKQVHFHEVGAADSIADIVGTAAALDFLKINSFSSRSVPTGSGFVKAAHGQMPVPTPATATLLQGIPLAASDIKTELTTPTGAAILSTVVSEWTDTPTMTIDRIGLGAGTKDFAQLPNILRMYLGTRREVTTTDSISKLETNLDDVSGEVIGYCIERLFQAGALDVFTTSIQMKKHRPGVLLTVLCENDKVAQASRLLFQETGTLGIRQSTVHRLKQFREMKQIDSPWGMVRVKVATVFGKVTYSAEYEDAARIARENNLPLREVMLKIERLA